MLVFKAWRKSPALTQETTPSQRRITRILSDAQQAAAAEVDAMLPQIAAALSRGQVERVVSMLPTEPWLVAQDALAAELLGELLDGGSRVSLPSVQKETMVFSFDRGRPESERWARNQAGGMITQINDEQRSVVREIVAQAASGGGLVDWTGVSRTVRGAIGLTTQQAGWVANHFQRAYTAAVQSGASLASAAGIAQRSTDRYQTSVHRYRANTIARTETMRAASEGRRQAWNQGLVQGFIDPSWEKEWIAEADACDICQDQDGKRVNVEGRFAISEPPAHPNCRCDVLLVPNKVKPPAESSPFDWLSPEAALDVLTPSPLPSAMPEFAPRPLLRPEDLPRWSGTLLPPALRPEDLPSYTGPVGRGWMAEKPENMSPEALDMLADEITEDYRSLYEEILWDAGLPGVPTEFEDLDEIGLPRTEADSFYEQTPDGFVLRIFLTGWWNGGQVFTASRQVNLTTGVVDHVEFLVSKQYQGTGIGWTQHEWLMEMYRRQGIRYVDTHANIDVGGYTWAKFGFDWADRYGPDTVGLVDQAAYEAERKAKLYDLRFAIDAQLNKIRRQVPSGADDVLDEIADYQDRLFGPVEEWPTPAELAALGWTPGADMWPGKAGMLRSSWYGRYYL